jgi:hypothetical protein
LISSRAQSFQKQRLVKLADRDFYADTRIAATTYAAAETDGRGFHHPDE